MGTMKMVRPLRPEVAHPADPPRLRAERGRKARRAGLCVRPTFVATDRPALLAHAAFTLAAEQLESARGARAWVQATIRLRTILAGADDELVRVCAEYLARTPSHRSGGKKLPALPPKRAKLLPIVD